MLAYIFVAFAAVCLLKLLRPIVLHLYDAKGFRKYPYQNILSGISPLAYGWEVGRPHRLFHTRRLHDQLVESPIVRIGPNWLSFGRAGAVRDIYGFNSPCRKGGIYTALKSDEGESLILSASKTAHAGRRRMLAASYAAGNIELWELRLAQSTTTLVSKLDAMCTAPPDPSTDSIPKEELNFDASRWSMLYAFECAIKIGVSKDVAFLAQGSDMANVARLDGGATKAPIIKCVHGSLRATFTLAWNTEHFSWLKRLASIVSPWYAQHRRNAGIWSAFIDQITLERVERGNGGKDLEDLMQPMIRDSREGTVDISDADRIAEVRQMVNGGGDKSGISLVNTLYHLLKNPDTLAKLRTELDRSLAREDTMAPWSKVKKMAYLRACIHESMRLSPPMAADLVRVTPPDRAYVIAGEVIPPSTNVSISAYTAHRDPSIFTDPEAFKPERWLTTDESQLRQMRAVYIPFSTGARACIGRNVALLMQLVFIGTIVHRYNFALPNTGWKLQWEEYFSLWPKELPLKIWRRPVDSSR